MYHSISRPIHYKVFITVVTLLCLTVQYTSATIYPPTAKIVPRKQGRYQYIVVPPTDTTQMFISADGKHPLVISLHGKSLSGSEISALTKYGTIAALNRGMRLPTYVIAPQCPSGQGWSPDKIMEVVNEVTQQYPIDTTRIYVLGMSMGGYGTFDLIGTYPNKIAAAVAMCGGGKERMASEIAKVPLWVIHGSSDVDVPVTQSRRMVAAVCAKNKDMCYYTELPRVGHSALAESYNHLKLYDWLLTHSRKPSDVATPGVANKPPSYSRADFGWLKYTNGDKQRSVVKKRSKHKHSKKRRRRTRR